MLCFVGQQIVESHVKSLLTYYWIIEKIWRSKITTQNIQLPRRAEYSYIALFCPKSAVNQIQGRCVMRRKIPSTAFFRELATAIGRVALTTQTWYQNKQEKNKFIYLNIGIDANQQTLLCDTSVWLSNNSLRLFRRPS